MAELRHNTVKKIRERVKIYQSFLVPEMFQEGNHLVPESEIEKEINNVKYFLLDLVGLSPLEVGGNIVT